MTSLLVNAIIGFWIILFGAMAILPFMFDSKNPRASEKTSPAPAEDRVLSIRPIGLVRQPEPELQTPASILAAASARATAQGTLDRTGGHTHRQAA